MTKKKKAKSKIQKEVTNWEKYLQLLEIGKKVNNNPPEKWLKDMNRDHRKSNANGL